MKYRFSVGLFKSWLLEWKYWYSEINDWFQCDFMWFLFGGLISLILAHLLYIAFCPVILVISICRLVKAMYQCNKAIKENNQKFIDIALKVKWIKCKDKGV